MCLNSSTEASESSECTAMMTDGRARKEHKGAAKASGTGEATLLLLAELRRDKVCISEAGRAAGVENAERILNWCGYLVRKNWEVIGCWCLF